MIAGCCRRLTETIQTHGPAAGAMVITGNVRTRWRLVGAGGPGRAGEAHRPAVGEELPSPAVVLGVPGYPSTALYRVRSDMCSRGGGPRENHARVGACSPLHQDPARVTRVAGTLCLALVRQGFLQGAADRLGGTYAFRITTCSGGPAGPGAAGAGGAMSTVSGALNSVGHAVQLRPLPAVGTWASERATVREGRIVTVCGMVAAIAWSPACSHYNTFSRACRRWCDDRPAEHAVIGGGVLAEGETRGAIFTLWWVGQA